jgi:hypothetical protein
MGAYASAVHGAGESAIELERYAEVRAEIEFGLPESDVLQRAGLTAEAWAAAEEHWQPRLHAELPQIHAPLTARYRAAFDTRKRALSEGDETLPLTGGVAKPGMLPGLPFAPETGDGPITPRVAQRAVTPPPPPNSSPALPFVDGVPPPAPSAPSLQSLQGLPFRAPGSGDAAPAPPSARPSSRGTRLALDRFAMLSAELALWPSATPTILARYDLDEPASASEGLLWQQRFASDRELYAKFAALVETYKEWLRASRP